MTLLAIVQKRRVLMGVHVGLLTVLLGACASNNIYTTGHTAINESALAYSKMGNGGPTIVFQAGLGDTKDTWSPIASSLARGSQVFAYDRPGYGDSKESSSPRDPCTIATELRSALHQAGVRPPFLLVGHSLGGIYQYAFAQMYSDDVLGMVLIDPTHPRHWEQIQAQSPTITATMKTLRLVSFSATQRREFDEQTNCLERFDLKQGLKMPVKVLFRTEYQRLEQGQLEKIVKELQGDWKTITGSDQVLYIQGASHYVHRDQPQQVITIISDFRKEIAHQAK
ncbi:alpha/beta hydrolase [Undibacterium cyanobacteriorum]|uniref:Alpha/beta hydrolase n=1 Tax=Undibacterium cyanobacteriorum TaxID=3073561 RepID=A0ABY9RHZ7_9BURK|nr:alpha/beta hydrolase [Undibacterium sp. 20NA77.5]WMW80841.1 alpha/beta hydrolase [Undibacterium sp. 20NA77.5]